MIIKINQHMLRLILKYEQEERLKNLYPREVGIIISKYLPEKEGIELIHELKIKVTNYEREKYYKLNIKLAIKIPLIDNIDINNILEKAIKKKIKNNNEMIYVRMIFYNYHNGHVDEIKKIINGEKQIREYLSLIADRIIDIEITATYNKKILEIESRDSEYGTDNFLRIINLNTDVWKSWINNLGKDKEVSTRTKKILKNIFNKN